VLFLVCLDQRGQHLQPVSRRRVGNRREEALDLFHGRLIIRLGFDGFNLHCSFLRSNRGGIDCFIFFMAADETDVHDAVLISASGGIGGG